MIDFRLEDWAECFDYSDENLHINGKLIKFKIWNFCDSCVFSSVIRLSLVYEESYCKIPSCSKLFHSYLLLPDY